MIEVTNFVIAMSELIKLHYFNMCQRNPDKELKFYHKIAPTVILDKKFSQINAQYLFGTLQK